MYSEVLSRIHTVQDLEYALADIDMLLAGIYKTGEESYENALSRVKIWLAEAIGNSQPGSGLSMEEYLRGLRDAVSNQEKIEITLAIEPTKEIAEAVSSWLYQNVSKSLVIDFSYDPGIIGGAVIDYRGKHLDKSFKPKIDEYFGASN